LRKFSWAHATGNNISAGTGIFTNSRTFIIILLSIETFFADVVNSRKERLGLNPDILSETGLQESRNNIFGFSSPAHYQVMRSRHYLQAVSEAILFCYIMEETLINLLEIAGFAPFA